MRFVASLIVAAAALAPAHAAAPAAAPIRQFDFGAYHRCALDAAGAVQCLGESNVFGQVGDGQTGDTPHPRPVIVIDKGAGKVVTGNFFSCAIVDGTLKCWGDTAAKMPGMPHIVIRDGVTDAAAGDDRVCAIVGDAAQCVGMGAQSGSNEYQQLHPLPYTEVEHGVRAIAVGHRHACAVSGDALVCWGDVPFDASDRGERVTRTATAVKVIEHGVTGVAAGAQHDCAIVDGGLWCWGENTRGQVGIGLDAAHAKASAAMPAANSVGRFDDGAQHCHASVGTVEACWASRPQRVFERGVTRVFAKGDETCALVAGELHCWGDNSRGQLGIAGGDIVDAPARALGDGVSSVALGGSRSCVIQNGTLLCTRPCRNSGGACKPAAPGFDTHDLAFGISDSEARLGVWRGTLGTQGIMVCLQRGPAAESSYYYLRHRSTIALRNEDLGDGKWREGIVDDKGTGDWELGAASGDTMSGTWSDPSSERTLPIRLTRVPVRGDPGASCGPFMPAAPLDAYNAPRVDAEKLVVGTPVDGLRTVNAIGEHLSVVEFAGDTPRAAAFNAAMRDWLREQIVGYFDCASMSSSAGEADFQQRREIELRAGPWVVVSESYDLYCGGAHPSAGISHQTWNLDSGKPVVPWTWIRGSKVKCDYSADCGYAAPEKLNALILAGASRNKDGDECADAVNENSSYDLRPSAQGLLFGTQFAHVIQACDEDVELTYAQVEPFLSDGGKRQLKSLIDAAVAQAKP